MTPTITEIEEVLMRAEGAWMEADYGSAAWRQCARFLLAQGHSPRAAAAILLSKHMRWADDGYGRGAGNRTNSTAFRKYYVSHARRGSWAAEAALLERETFDMDDLDGGIVQALLLEEASWS